MGRRPLTPDRYASVTLYTDAGTFAVRIARREMTEPAAVAGLALDVPPGRTDILDGVAATIRNPAMTRAADLDWPPRASQLALLARARRVMVGDVALVGPGGARVEQVEVTWPGQPARRLLRLTVAGRHVGDYRSVDELARRVDLSTLIEELPPAPGQTASHRP